MDTTRPTTPLWRSRWAAIGAALAVALGGSGLYMAQASGTASAFVPVTPTRVLDTRVNLGLSGPFATGVARILDIAGVIPVAPSGTATVVPDGATAVVLNVTAIQPTGGGFISIRPGDAAGDPTTSNLNFPAGAVIPNGVSVQLPLVGANSGKLNLFYFGGTPGATVHMLVDIVGYYQADSGGPQGSPGLTGPSANANRISDAQIGMLRWDQDPGRGARIIVGVSPTGVAFSDDYTWVSNNGEDTVSKIDPTTNAVVDTVDVGTEPAGIAFDGTSIWVANQGDDSVSRIDPATGDVTATVLLGIGSAPYAVAFDGSFVWVTNVDDDSVSKIDPNIDDVTLTLDLGLGTAPQGLAFDGTNMWVTDFGTDSVSAIDVTTNAIAGPFSVGGFGALPFGIVFDGTSLWVANSGLNTVSKLDLAGFEQDQITVGPGPRALAFDGTSVWVTTIGGTPTISKINPTTNQVPSADIISPFFNGFGIGFDGTNIWVVSSITQTVTKFIPF